MTDTEEIQLTINDLEKWIEWNGPKLLLFAQQQTQNFADAQDVYQNAIIKVLKSSRQKDKGKIPPLSFFFTSIRHSAIDFYRQHQRRKHREVLFVENEEQSEGWFVKDIETREEHNRIEHLIQTLPQDQQEVVLLRIWGEQSFKMIGKILDIPQNTAASRYRYALSQLRTVLNLQNQTS